MIACPQDDLKKHSEIIREALEKKRVCNEFAKNFKTETIMTSSIF